MTECFSTAIVRARKRHICSWHPYKTTDPTHEHWIEPGEVYERSVNRGDGRVWTWKACSYHRAAAAATFDIYGMHELTDHELTDQLYEWWGEAERHAERGQPFPMPFDAHATLGNDDE